ncbi:lipid-A-disaccharide synthase [Afifella sp. IM 167]|uniref:lipid-A-disaccharide synthase n=1 Tax=Afifella sp. IM 167 TaxID=2033586 RepID=UPI001CCD8AD9|nr:lipid-A-disaccharide synthase [Afifella sp. IM 167]
MSDGSARPLRIALVIGEASGDHLGAGLVAAIRRERPDTEFFGLAGERLEELGVKSLFPIEDVSVMGFVAVVARLPTILRRIRETVAHVVAGAPDVLVIIDSPGFTHSVAKRVRKRLPDLPVLNYVSPSVWAWNPGRAPRMTRYVDHVLALLPFEPEVHEKLGGPPCTYVGHPLIERRAQIRPAEGERGDLAREPVVLILPGSRHSEIKRLMEPFGATVARIASHRPETRFILPAVSHLADEIRARTAAWPVAPEIVLGEADKLKAFRRAHAALAASGTVTLELALAGVPMVVAYRVDPLARRLRWLLRVPSIVLANLVLGENAVPEFIDEEGPPEVLAGNLLPLLADGPARRAQLRAFDRLDAIMVADDGRTPSERAAAIVLAHAAAGT